MGSRIAGRLLARGHELVVWNRNPAKGEPLVAAGATAVASPAEAARRAEALLIMVSDPDALAQVAGGPEGVAAGLEAGGSAVVVQMSTVGPAAIARLAQMSPAGARLLDAPVLGSLSEAESGTLTIYAGGDEELVERWRPLLSELGEVLHVGPVGAGSAAKLVANATLVGLVGILGEALALARGLGLPGATAFEVLATTALAEQAERRRPAVESGEYPPRFALSLARKDADLILETGLDLRVLGAARTWLVEAEEAGLGEEDYSAALGHTLERASQPGSQANSTT
jgi:3-hydroxyisobutyrate dehydrogenase-like beta-hydroxyacid dehydrogenase